MTLKETNRWDGLKCAPTEQTSEAPCIQHLEGGRRPSCDRHQQCWSWVGAGTWQFPVAVARGRAHGRQKITDGSKRFLARSRSSSPLAVTSHTN